MKKRSGFTLVELVVVVMIIGILAAVAAPKMITISKTATDNSARHSLEVVRDAVENYAAENGGTWPTTQAQIETRLRGPFPKCPIKAGTRDQSLLAIVTAGTVLRATGADSSSTEGMWKYDSKSGEVIINYDANDNAGVAYDEY